MHKIIVILLLIPLLLCACIAPTGLVGFATVSGDVDVRTDGNIFLALGQGEGEAGIFVKGSGFPLTAPFLVTAGDVYLRNDSLDIEVALPLGSGLPDWCEPLFRPGEVELLEQRFNIDIFFVPGPSGP